MDNFKVIYRILHYLEKAMDLDEIDEDRLSPETLGITPQRWAALWGMLAKEGYVDVEPSRNPRITLRGLEYLQENALMKKAAQLAKGIAEILKETDRTTQFCGVLFSCSKRGEPRERPCLPHGPAKADQAQILRSRQAQVKARPAICHLG